MNYFLNNSKFKKERDEIIKERERKVRDLFYAFDFVDFEQLVDNFTYPTMKSDIVLTMSKFLYQKLEYYSDKLPMYLYSWNIKDQKDKWLYIDFDKQCWVEDDGTKIRLKLNYLLHHIAEKVETKNSQKELDDDLKYETETEKISYTLTRTIEKSEYGIWLHSFLRYGIPVISRMAISQMRPLPRICSDRFQIFCIRKICDFRHVSKKYFRKNIFYFRHVSRQSRASRNSMKFSVSVHSQFLCLKRA